MGHSELNATVDETEESMETATAQGAVGAPLSENGLKEKYGKLYEISNVVDEDDLNEGRTIKFLFKKPSAASFNRYIKNASKDMMKATKIFVKDSIIEEQAATLEKECSAYPALALGIGQKLLSVLGASDNINFKKL